MAMRRILLINGPNMDMLGTREPNIYGTDTLANLEEMVMQYASRYGVSVSCFQSNSESKLIERIHEAPGKFDGIVYNPGAHTHYSYALRDAISAIETPVIEVHISMPEEREAFRWKSVIAPVCVAQVKGLGSGGYCRAIDILCENDRFSRMGEGFESRFPPHSHIIVAQQASEPAPLTDAESEPISPIAPYEPRTPDAPGIEYGTDPEPLVAMPPSDRKALADFTEAYEKDVACENAGLISRERQSLVRETCAQLGLDGILIRDTPNIHWLTAFDGVFDEERAHALLLTSHLSVLHSDSRYAGALRLRAAQAQSETIIDDSRMAHHAFAHGRISTPDSPFEGVLGIEDSISYAEFANMASSFGTPHLAATTNLVLGLRAVKSPSELNRMRAAQAVADAAFQHVIRIMKPGMTERQVQIELEDFMVRHGAEGLAFSSIVATGANGADPHATPGKTLLEAGQCVVMDFGAKAFGYCSDTTRVVFLGHPDRRMEHAWSVLRQANEAVESALRPGITGKEAHELAESVLAEGGYGGRMGHGLGHGVGMEVHELPVLNTRNDNPLVAGNVVTVEPGIYIPGEFGMRLEDCGVVTESGFEVFSQLGHEMVII